MANLIEVFDKLGKIYNDGVEENDNKYPFLPEAYKTLTEKFVAKVEEELEVHIIDLEYLDGYYLFGYGTNSVIHFRIKECKGWKFGIWWGYNEEEHFKYTGELFAQYEKAIDKFKPEDSELIENIRISEVDDFDKDKFFYETSIKMIKYIKDYPAFAFCTHWSGWSGKYDYMPYSKAKKELRWFNRSNYLCELANKWLTNRVIRFIKWNFLRYLPKKWEIVDRGDAWYPRYEIVMPMSAFKDATEKDCGIWRFDESNIPNVDKKLKKLKKFDKLENKLSKMKIFRGGMSYINGVRNIRACINIYNDKKLKEKLKEMIEEEK